MLWKNHFLVSTTIAMTPKEFVVLTQQRLYAKVIFDTQFMALLTNAFQEFFHKLMQYRYSLSSLDASRRIRPSNEL